MDGDNGKGMTMKTADSQNAPSVTFRFKNLGPIEDAALRLGDLTIIAGRNNTGKTYLAYALYGFLKVWESWPGADDYFLSGDPTAGVARLISETISEGNSKRQVERDTLSQERQVVLKSLTRDFSDYFLANLFNAPTDDLEDASVEVEVSPGFENVQELKREFRGDKEFVIGFDGAEIHMACSDPELDETDQFWLSQQYLRFLFHNVFEEPFVLCAERFGISLFYKELDFNKNRVVDLLQKMGDDKSRKSLSPFDLIEGTTGRYALPIKDNINFTRDLPNIQKEKSDVYENKLFDDVKDIMAGYYRSSDDEVRFISKARKHRSFNIPLHRASSSARGLSDLYFFLRHVAKENHLLIIDEPESHLDTANQIQFARLLARLVKAGVRVLITTHSDYIVKEVNNLIMLSRSFDDKNKLIKRLKYDKQDFIDPDQVRAYVAEKGTLTPCVIDQFGIDFPVFDETINDINSVTSELASRVMLEERC